MKKIFYYYIYNFALDDHFFVNFTRITGSRTKW